MYLFVYFHCWVIRFFVVVCLLVFCVIIKVLNNGGGEASVLFSLANDPEDSHSFVG